MDWEHEARHSVAFGRTTVGYDRLVRPDGERTREAWVDRPDAACVVALAGDDVVFVKEYRPRLREPVVTCPTGRVERGESFREAGARELREEAGYVAGDTRLLEAYYPTSWLRKRRGVVLATGCEAAEPDREADEFMDVIRVPRERAVERARTGTVTGWTLPALLLAEREGVLRE